MLKQTKVGLVVLVALVVLAATIFTLGEQQHLWERKVQYEIHFARTNGLQVGGIVSLTGVTVGSVADMSFPSDPTTSYIQVLVNVAGAVAPRIRENSVATIRTYGLLGDRYVELSAGTPDSPPLPAGSLIASIDPVDYEAILGQSGDIVTNVVEVTASLKSVLQSIEHGEGLLGAMIRSRDLGEATLVDFRKTMDHLEQTTGSLEEMVGRVNRGEGVIGRLTRNTKQGDQLMANVSRAARSLDAFTAQLSSGRGVVGRLVDDEAYARRLLGNLDQAVADLAAVAAKLDRGEGTLGKLVNDPALYDDAHGLVGGARRSWLLRLFGVGGSPPPDKK
jgi:phospholipid/cholesterol/gamma-HCH transport system substrate-binding protein